MAQSIRYNNTNLTSFLEEDTLEQVKGKASVAYTSVEQNLSEGKYGFVTELENQDSVVKMNELYEALEWSKYFVVIGTGGPGMGALVLQNALQGEHAPKEVLFHGSSPDPRAIQDLFRSIDLESTVFVIISKSGQTVETISQYVFLKEYVKEHVEDWQKHFVFITDGSAGLLRPEGKEHGVKMLRFPDAVGGRYSLLTNVGLFAALGMGVDIEEMLTAAKAAAKNETFRKQAHQFAADQFALYLQGIKHVAVMPYALGLEVFAAWFRQLWAESLGKDGKGILPIQARGPVDQHSQLQFYAQGELMQSLLFIAVKEFETDFSIDTVSVGGVEFLEGKSFSQILGIEQQATELALKKVGRPSATLEVESISAKSIAEMAIFFMLAVTYLGEMMEVNVFDQPGVEQSKKMMYALLGREGFEDVLKEIETLRNS